MFGDPARRCSSRPESVRGRRSQSRQRVADGQESAPAPRKRAIRQKADSVARSIKNSLPAKAAIVASPAFRRRSCRRQAAPTIRSTTVIPQLENRRGAHWGGEWARGPTSPVSRRECRSGRDARPRETACPHRGRAPRYRPVMTPSAEFVHSEPYLPAARQSLSRLAPQLPVPSRNTEGLRRFPH